MTKTYSKANMCNTDGPVSFCRVAKKSIDVQSSCTYFEKARYADRCMYLVFDEYCDNLYAQKGIEQPKKESPK